jgi:hypothetical protein
MAGIADTVDEVQTAMFEHSDPTTFVRRALFVLRKVCAFLGPKRSLKDTVAPTKHTVVQELVKCAMASLRDRLCDACFSLRQRWVGLSTVYFVENLWFWTGDVRKPSFERALTDQGSRLGPSSLDPRVQPEVFFHSPSNSPVSLARRDSRRLKGNSGGNGPKPPD